LFEGFAFALVYDVQEEYIDGVLTKNIFTKPCKDNIGTLPSPGDTIYNYAYAREINSLYGPRIHFTYHEFFFEVFPVNGMTYVDNYLLCYSSDQIDLYQPDVNNDCFNGVSATDEFSKTRFYIYPNPASSSFTITNPEQIKSIRIYDLQGRLQDQNAALPMDVVHLSAGVYWVHLEALDGKTSVEKLVIE
jgi:hypothetical protein